MIVLLLWLKTDIGLWELEICHGKMKNASISELSAGIIANLV
jgi:hypothetical protein